VANKEKKKPKYNKRKFIVAFIATMGFFAIIRHGFSLNIPMREVPVKTQLINTDTIEEDLIAETEPVEVVDVPEDLFDHVEDGDSIPGIDETEDSLNKLIPQMEKPSSQLGHNGHRVIGVHSWTECFPDSQSLQIVAAKKNGIKPCVNRTEAQRYVKTHKLVNISNSPFYRVDDLRHSMPYLVPKAQHLLNTISLNFIDSLQVKGIPPHLPMVTSVLRTTDDISSLQRGNKNSVTNSCHCYGTTVDITYNRFVPLTGHYDPKAELTRWDLPMKQVMTEVLRDLREQGLCYVKYERKQACFHLTVR